MYLFCDVDDTICPSTKPVGDAMKAEIERLISAGHLFVFISGSTLDQIQEQLKPINGSYHLLGTSGTACAYIKNHERNGLYKNDMPFYQRQTIMDAFTKILKKYKIPSAEDQIQDRGSQVTLSAIGRYADAEDKKNFDPDCSKRKQWAKEIEAIIGPGYSIKIGGTTSVDITPYGVDKGWGVKHFLNYMGWDSRQCIFYGDKLVEGGNDYPVKGILKCVEVKSPEDTLIKLMEYK